MGKLTQSEREQLNHIFKKYELNEDDIFSHKHYKIITRPGIDKIQAKADINITYEIVGIKHSGDWITENRGNGEKVIAKPGDVVSVVVKAAASMPAADGKREYIETFGESSLGNNDNNYPVAMAEKRAMSRAVLKLAGLYQEGVFGEDEADEFKEAVKSQRQQSNRQAFDKRQ